MFLLLYIGILPSQLSSVLFLYIYAAQKVPTGGQTIGAVPSGVLSPHHGYQIFEEPPCQGPQSRCTGEAEVPGLAFQKFAALKSLSSIVRKDARPRLTYSFDTLK